MEKRLAEKDILISKQEEEILFLRGLVKSDN
jgi:hypothetical protein